MSKRIIILFFVLICFKIFTAEDTTNEKNNTKKNFVFVEGGEIINPKSFFYKKSVKSFYISKYEVTQGEWVEIMDTNPSSVIGKNLPVDKVSWYDAIEYCNKRSIIEGLTPYYNINKEIKDPNNNSKYDDKKYLITINLEANGYRLPTEIEWEYAACGGKNSKLTFFSGSNEPELVAVYKSMFENNENIKTVGLKMPNELDLYDMCGNVSEWCWDWYTDNKENSYSYKVIRGGSFESNLYEIQICYRGDYKSPIYSYKGVGFRLVRNKLD